MTVTAVSTALGLLLSAAAVAGGAPRFSSWEEGPTVPDNSRKQQEQAPPQALDWFFDVSGGLQFANVGSSPPTAFDHPLFGPEPGSIDTRYRASRAALFEASIGYRVQDHVAIAVAVGRTAHDMDVGVTAELPHPFFFDRPRAVEGTAGVERSELALHLSLMWRIREGGNVEFALLGGPSWFKFEQELALGSGLRFESEYPYDAANFAGVAPQAHSTAATGYHVGAEVAWWFRPRTGLLATVRFTEAPTEFELDDDARLDIDAGGVQASIGLRLRF